MRRFISLLEDGKVGVRWDSVARQNTFWSPKRAPDATPAIPATPSTTAVAAAASVDVQVWLFGMLAGPDVKNPLVLQLGAGVTLRGVIGELGRRLGPDLLRNMISDSGEIFNTCRVFVDGIVAKDMAAPISGGGSPATVEIILLQDIEGG